MGLYKNLLLAVATLAAFIMFIMGSAHITDKVGLGDKVGFAFLIIGGILILVYVFYNIIFRS